MLQEIENLEKLENQGKKLKCPKNLEIGEKNEYLTFFLKLVEKFGNVEKLKKNWNWKQFANLEILEI